MDEQNTSAETEKPEFTEGDKMLFRIIAARLMRGALIFAAGTVTGLLIGLSFEDEDTCPCAGPPPLITET